MRKKGLFYFIVSAALLLALGYFFRFPLFSVFQSSRIHALHCPGVNGATGCRNKIWVHRVNSLPRYDLLAGQFDGFETDIYFNNSSGSFSVYHPPVPQEGDTLSFDHFLSHVDLAAKHFWLDTRGVDMNNAKKALDALQATGKSDLLRKNCIFELYDAGAAAEFSKAGYTASFDIAFLEKKKMASDSHFADSINGYLENVKYVSAESGEVGQMKKMFPAKKIITWHLHYVDYLHLSKIQRLLDDDQIDIVLLQARSRYYR
ncbi:MAG TPA: hypothetical protein VK644_01365 [Chitinophagaceae bacterium]|nr:hypothetical protein [Chitinophagaceae bacterium]